MNTTDTHNILRVSALPEYRREGVFPYDGNQEVPKYVVYIFKVLLTVHHAMILGNCPT